MDFITPTIIVQILASALMFVLFWQLIGVGIFKPFLDLLIERDERTVGDISASTKVEAETEELKRAISGQLRQARIDGMRARDAVILNAKAEAAEVIKGAQLATQEVLQYKRQDIAKLKASALSESSEEIKAIADRLKEAVVPKNTTIH